MGLRFRKTIKAGPLRFTVSKSGVSTSFGGKGARITKLANGRTRTTLSVLGTGISYVSESSPKSKKSKTTQKKNSTVQKSFSSYPVNEAPMTVTATRSFGVIFICIGVLLTFMLPPIGIALAAFGIYRFIKAPVICEKYNKKLREGSVEKQSNDQH